MWHRMMRLLGGDAMVMVEPSETKGGADRIPAYLQRQKVWQEKSKEAARDSGRSGAWSPGSHEVSRHGK